MREALDLTSEPLQRAEIAADLVQLMMVAGQWEAPAAVAQAALGDLSEGLVHDAPTVRVLAWWASFAGFDPRRAHQLDANMEPLLTAAQGDAAGSRLLAGVLAANLISRGERLDLARELLDRALQEGHLAAQISTEAPVVSQAMFAAMFLDDIPRAESLVSWLLTLSRSHGSVVGVSVAACLQAAIQARRGDLAAAEANMRQIADLAVAHGLSISLPQALYWCTDALVERPGIADLAGFAQAVEPAPELAPTMFGAMVNEVRGRLALAAGDFPAARTELHSAARIYSVLRQFNPNMTCWRSALALAIAAEDRAEALVLAGSELADARRLGVLRPAGIALCAQGVIADGEQGLGDLAESARMLAAAGARLEQARALVELGAALRRRNQRAAAREPLRAGLDLAQRCGAIRLAQRATDELRATGARPRRAVLTGLEALTASERRIAERAAEGLSNPEIAQALFITLNTVESHLRHAYQKLSINSRGQLPAALAAAAHEG
jgi:DNA-binding CsgD family transcriptional regulator